MYGPQVQGPLPVLSVHRKVISKMGGTLKNRLGSPDLLVSQVLGILVTLAIVVVLDLALVAAVRAAFGRCA